MRASEEKVGGLADEEGNDAWIDGCHARLGAIRCVPFLGGGRKRKARSQRQDIADRLRERHSNPVTSLRWHAR